MTGRGEENAYPFELLDVPGALNVRDLGGYRGEDGQTVVPRRFIRAAALHGLGPEGLEALRRLGVDCVVDLRSKAEVSRKPDVLPPDGSIAYLHISMLDYIQSGIAEMNLNVFPASMGEMYTGLLDNAQACFLQLFQAFASPDYRTIVFHCTAGKDRTGVSAMLLLGLGGVSREDIVEDYRHSGTLYSVRPLAGLPDYLFQSRPETMEAALEHLDKRYGGIRAYLKGIGVTDAMEREIRAKLFAP